LKQRRAKKLEQFVFARYNIEMLQCLLKRQELFHAS